jgi:hypothetical protein
MLPEIRSNNGRQKITFDKQLWQKTVEFVSSNGSVVPGENLATVRKK